jgi:hypothetical protein
VAVNAGFRADSRSNCSGVAFAVFSDDMVCYTEKFANMAVMAYAAEVGVELPQIERTCLSETLFFESLGRVLPSEYGLHDDRDD